MRDEELDSVMPAGFFSFHILCSWFLIIPIVKPVFFLLLLSSCNVTFKRSNEKLLFSAVDMFVSGYFAAWLLSINKPPFFAVDMLGSCVFCLPMLMDHRNDRRWEMILLASEIRPCFSVRSVILPVDELASLRTHRHVVLASKLPDASCIRRNVRCPPMTLWVGAVERCSLFHDSLHRSCRRDVVRHNRMFRKDHSQPSAVYPLSVSRCTMKIASLAKARIMRLFLNVIRKIIKRSVEPARS